MDTRDDDERCFVQCSNFEKCISIDGGEGFGQMKNVKCKDGKKNDRPGDVGVVQYRDGDLERVRKFCGVLLKNTGPSLRDVRRRRGGT